MPVTVRLSRLFYERFGDKIVNELVEWFNQVDTTYRNELRELNELNFARFESKLEQRMAQLESKLVRWMFLFWIGQAATTVGLVFAVVKLR